MLCVIYYFYSFNKANDTQKSEIKNEGGMLVKYSILINHLVDLDNKMMILNSTDTSITIGHNNPLTSMNFHLQEVFGKLHLKWTIQDINIGRHTLNWEFNNNSNQHLIIEEIELRFKRWDIEMSETLTNRI